MLNKSLNQNQQLYLTLPFSPETISSIYKSYERLKDQYTAQYPNQYTILILTLMTKTQNIPKQYKSFPLLRLFKSTCELFLLNDLEIIMWSYIIEHVVWTRLTRPIQILALYSAYYSKFLMNFQEDMEIIDNYLKAKYKGFFVGIDNWKQENADRLQIKLVSFNKYMNKFHDVPLSDMTNYNYYVDEILFFSPPSISECEDELNFYENSLEDTQEQLSLRSVLDDEEYFILQNCFTQDLLKDISIINDLSDY